MSPKAKALYNLYIRGKITIEGLRKAVQDKTITAEEFFLITREEY